MAEGPSVELMNEIEISGSEMNVRGRLWMWVGVAVFLGAFALLMASSPAEAIPDQNDYVVTGPGPEVWDLAGNPDGVVVINGTLTIGPAGVLIVDGITVAFDNTWQFGGPVPASDGVSTFDVYGGLQLVNGAFITTNQPSGCGDGCDYNFWIQPSAVAALTFSRVTYSTGLVVLSDNVLLQSALVWNPNADGIQVFSSRLDIRDSTVDNNGGQGVWADPTGDLTLTISGSSFDNNGGVGIYVWSSNVLTFDFTNSRADSNTGANLYFIPSDSDVRLTIQSSSASNGGGSGLYVGGSNAGNLTAVLDQFTVTGNPSSGVWLGSFYSSGVTGGSADVTLRGSILSLNAGDGLRLDYAARDVGLDVQGSNLSWNGGSSLVVGQTDGDLVAVLDTSTFTDTGGVGAGFIQVGGFADVAITGSDLSRHGSFDVLMVDVYGGLALTVSGSNLSDSQASNVLIDGVWSGGAFLSFSNSVLSGASESGLQMTSAYGGATVILTNTQLSRNRGFGAVLDEVWGIFTLQMTDSRVVDNGAAGIGVFTLEMGGAGDLSTVTLTNTLFQNNNIGGLYLGDVNGGSLSVTASTVTFADHSSFGFYRDAFNGAPGSLARYSFTDTTITNTWNGVGIGIGYHNGGDAALFLGGDLTLTQNGEGLYMDWVNGGGLALTVSLSSGNISGNNGNGIYVSGFDPSNIGSVDVSMTGVTANNKGGNAIYLLGGGCFPVTSYSVVLSGSSFSNNLGGSGFYVDCVQVAMTVDAVVDLDNVVADGNGVHGVYLGPASPLSPAQFSGFLPAQRFGTSAIYDGQYAYIFGGFDGWINSPTDQIVQYDLVTGNSIVLGSTLPFPRAFTAAVWDGSQYAYIFGGAQWWFGGFTDEIVRFEPATGNVQVVSNLWWDMAGFSAVWDDTRGVAYLFGGQASWDEPRYEIFEFDPSSGNVNQVGDMPWVYRTFTTSVWDGQYAYIFGGTDTCYFGCWQSDQVVRFDPSTGNAQIVAYGFPVHSSSAVMINGQVWVFGGGYCWATCLTSEVWVFDTTTYSYAYAGFSLPVQRSWASAVTDGTNAYLIGGAYPWDWGWRVIDVTIPTRMPTLAASITNSGLTNNGCHGFYLGQWFGDDTVMTSGMTATGNGCHGFYFGGTYGSTTNSVTMAGDTVAGNGDTGIWLGDIYGSVSISPAVPVDFNGCNGIYVAYVHGGDFTLDLTGLGASNNGCSGVWLGQLWYGTLTALFGGATFSQNGESGAVLLWDSCYPLNGLVLDIATAQFDYNGAYGFYLDCISGPDLDITLDTRTYTGNGDYALYFGGVSYGAVRMSVTNSDFLLNGGGIHFPNAWDISTSGAYSIVFNDNLVDGQFRCCEAGVWIGSLSNGWVDGTVTVLRNTLTSNWDDGLWIGGINGCATCWPANTRIRTFTVDISDNSIRWNGDDGIYISNLGTTEATITATRNNVTGNGGDGFNLNNQDEAGRATLWVTDSTFDMNGQNGVSLPYMEDVGAWLSATLMNLVLTDNGQWGCCYAGIYLGQPEYGPIEFLIDTVTVSGSYYGIYLDASASPFVGEIRSSSVTGAVYGIASDGGDNGVVQVTLWNSTVTGSSVADLYLNRGTSEYFTLVNSPYDTRAVYPWADCGLYGNPACSWILHQWFYHVQVLTGATLTLPAPGAFVAIERNGVPAGTFQTGADGMVWWLLGSEWAYSVPYQVYYSTTVSASNGVVTAAVSDVVDTNGMTITVLLGGDWDADGVPDLIDNDDDNDGWADTQDAFPNDPTEWLDTDSDGIGNNVDPDDDNDGVVDPEDACPENSLEYLDTDLDGVCNNLDADDDNDGVPDSNDAFPVDPTEWRDLDGDGIGDYLDPDDDGDSVIDLLDAFPDSPGEWLDTDGDGIGNNADNDDDNDGVSDGNDAFPDDGTEWRDLDGDGVGDAADVDDDGDGVPDANDPLPDNPNEWLDTDGDGLGDNADNDDDNDGVSDANDAFPDDGTESRDLDGDGVGDNADTDMDGDGVADVTDAFDDSPGEWLDTDGDGIGDNADLDDDADGVPDANDDFPADDTEVQDTDGDGLGDNTDTDDDNDGRPDLADPQPKIPNAPDPVQDTDGDGIPDTADSDDDGDGVPDATDRFQTNPNEWNDFDGDRMGDNADWDDDADGWSDLVEAQVGTNPLSNATADIPTDTDGDGIADSQDADIDGDTVFNENDAYPFDASRSQATNQAQVDATGALLVPLYILVVLAVLALLLFLLRKPRRPLESPELDAMTPLEPLVEPKAPEPTPTTIDGPLLEPKSK